RAPSSGTRYKWRQPSAPHVLETSSAHLRPSSTSPRKNGLFQAVTPVTMMWKTGGRRKPRRSVEELPSVAAERRRGARSALWLQPTAQSPEPRLFCTWQQLLFIHAELT